LEKGIVKILFLISFRKSWNINRYYILHYGALRSGWVNLYPSKDRFCPSKNLKNLSKIAKKSLERGLHLPEIAWQSSEMVWQSSEIAWRSSGKGLHSSGRGWELSRIVWELLERVISNNF